MKKFKVQGVGLDVSTLDFELPDELNYDYLYTSLNSINSSFYVKWLKNHKNSPLIVSTDFLDCGPTMHYYYNKVKRPIDLLLVDASCDFVKYSEVLNVLLEEKIVLEIGIKNPESVERLEEIKKAMDFDKISLEISPLNYNCEIMDWCSKNNVIVFGLNPFGGHLTAPSIIDSFSVTYLLNFIALNSDVVILSGRDPYLSDSSRKYLSQLIGKEVDDRIYQVKKTINKLVKPLKKVVYTSIDAGNFLIPNNLPEYYYNFDEIVLGIGSQPSKPETVEEDSVEYGIAEQVVVDTITNLSFPEDSKEDIDNIPLLLYTIESVFKSYGRLVEFGRVGATAFVVSTGELEKKRKHLVKTYNINTKAYLVSYENGSFVFKQLNSDFKID